jgi:hypothetical protein
MRWLGGLALAFGSENAFAGGAIAVALGRSVCVREGGCSEGTIYHHNNRTHFRIGFLNQVGSKL